MRGFSQRHIAVSCFCLLVLFTSIAAFIPAAEEYDLLLGAPLISVVTSQAIAAVDALGYVVRTAFDADKGSVNVQFHFDEKDEETNETTTKAIDLPLITLMPLPFIRLEECTLEFNAKMITIQSAPVDRDTNGTSDPLSKAGEWVGGDKVKMAASYSGSFTSVGTNVDETEFSLRIKITAQQAPVPAGFQRVLETLRDAIYDEEVK